MKKFYPLNPLRRMFLGTYKYYGSYMGKDTVITSYGNGTIGTYIARVLVFIKKSQPVKDFLREIKRK